MHLFIYFADYYSVPGTPRDRGRDPLSYSGNMQTQRVLCARDALRGLHSPSHFCFVFVCFFLLFVPGPGALCGRSLTPR